MDFELSPEQKKLKATAKEFVEEYCIPLEKTWPEFAPAPTEEVKRLRKMMQARELIGISVPEQYGGRGLGALGYVSACQEIAKTPVLRFDFGVRGFDPHPGLYEGTEYQKEKYLVPTAKGEKTYIFAFSEPNAGSDLAAMQTRAVREGDNYILSGIKIFSPDPNNFDYTIVYAVTDPNKGHRGISVFLVDRGTPGYRVTRLIETMGFGKVAEIVYENCKVPAANLLGQEGEGFRLGQRELNSNRIMIGCGHIGIAERCLSMAKDYAKQRVTFGQPLAERQAIQWMLADSALEIETGRWLGYHAAWKLDKGEDVRMEAAMVKLHGLEVANRVVDRAMQIFGGMGYTKELIIERFYRFVRASKIAEGTTEMMKRVIARGLLKD
jgi:acyl-CoA dehydrogenase